uniref:Metallothionein n=1 Tax=Steinernema glaseri TaxID=37863 RepID=A0A1I7Y9Y6_9BILA
MHRPEFGLITICYRAGDSATTGVSTCQPCPVFVVECVEGKPCVCKTKPECKGQDCCKNVKCCKGEPGKCCTKECPCPCPSCPCPQCKRE